MSDLLTRAKEIKNATEIGENTAERVGGVMVDMVESIMSAEESLTAHEDTLTTHGKQISALQTKVQDVMHTNTEQQTAINSQGTRLTEVEHRADEHDTQIAQINTDMKQMDDNILRHGEEIEDLQDADKAMADELEKKAPKVGYAPDLKVNFAKELTGRGEATPQVIGKIRPTGEISIGDGNATIEKVKGKSVVWNQLVKNHDFSQGLEGWGVGSGVSSKELNADGSLRMTYKGGEYDQDIRQSNRVINIGHKIIVSAVCNVVGGYKISHIINGSEITFNTVQGIHEYVGILEVKRDLFTDIRFCAIDISNNIPEYVDVYSAKLIDLTQMFGEGNEPTTIEEFEARKPLGVTDEYNEGEIISYDGANALQSIGFNAWDEEWGVGRLNPANGVIISSKRIYSTNYISVIQGKTYNINVLSIIIFYDKNKKYVTSHVGKGEFTIPSGCVYIRFSLASDDYGNRYNHDICIHLVHSGYRNDEYKPYEEDTLQLPDVKVIKDKDGNMLFPYGLLSAGSVYDEITATKAIKRIGVVDMGTLKWFDYNQYNYGFISGIVNGIKQSNLNFETPLNYKKTVLSSTNWAVDNDKFITTNPQVIGPSFSNCVLIKDTSITDLETFKQAMQGVLLYYELAEPIEVDLEEPLNLTYEAWDFGTEELHTEAKTTPLNADISYQFNAVDRIRENTTKASDLEARVLQLEAKLTQMAQASESSEA